MKIQVIGLGLIGGSLCKAIRRNTDHTVLGMDRNSAVLQKAEAEGAIHSAGTLESLTEADLVIVCLYPEASVRFLLDHCRKMKRGSLACDVCGIKAAIVDAAEEPLARAGVRFVGCHPMAGREFSGFDYSREDLFDGASFILTPGRLADPDAVRELADFARSIGFGRTITASPEEHDSIIAATSQLAHVVSNAYIKSPTLRKEAGFSAGSYLDLTRVAKLNEEMWTSLFLLNKEPLLHEIDILLENLRQYRGALAREDAASLSLLLKEGRLLKEEDLRKTENL